MIKITYTYIINHGCIKKNQWSIDFFNNDGDIKFLKFHKQRKPHMCIIFFNVKGCDVIAFGDWTLVPQSQIVLSNESHPSSAI